MCRAAKKIMGEGEGGLRFYCGLWLPRLGPRRGIRGRPTFIKAGTLDDPSWLAPNMHIWCAEKLPWVGIPEGATRHPPNPS